MNQTKPSQFGLMLTNLAAAIGIKTAIQTVNTATKTLDQQCNLQEQEAKAMGGIGEGPGKGLIMLELDTQVQAAQESGAAITDSAFGSLVAGGVALAGVGISLGIFGKVGKNEDLESELKNAEEFKTQLNDGKTGDLEIGEENDQLAEEDHTESDKIKAEIDGLEKSGKAKVAMSNQKNTELNNLSDELTNLSAKERGLDDQVSQKSSEVDAATAIRNKYKEELDHISENFRTTGTTKDLPSYTRDYSAKRTELDNAEINLTKLTKEHEDLQKEAATVKGNIATKNTEYTKVEQERDTLKDDGISLLEQLEPKQAAYDQMRADEKVAAQEKAAAQDKADDAEADVRIAKWKGNAMKDPDFSNFKKESKDITEEEKSELRINKKALAKIKNGNPKVKAEINHNIERNISRLNEKISAHKTQKQNSWIQVAQQGVTSGTSFAQGSGQMGQGNETILSQTDQAYSGVIEKVLQNTTQQVSAAASQASTDQGEIANILQNIAFPA